MNRRVQLEKEWQDILDLAKHSEALAQWLKAREEAYKFGQRTDGYTNAIRKEYRLILSGKYE